MRILHLSDIHIGVENYGRPATETDIASLPECFAPGVDRETYLGFSTRLLDFLATFDEIIHYATEESVDLVVFSGDAYRTRDPSQTHQREFARRISTLVSRNIPTFLLIGNHDVPHSLGRATSLEIFDTLKVPKVWVGERLETHWVESNAGWIQIISVPWIRRGALISREEQQGRTVEELTRYIEDALTSRLQEEVSRLDRSYPAILSGHVTLAGAQTSSERSMMLGRDYILQRSSIALPELDYVALGHIHKHQSFGTSPPVVYPGSLQRVDFSEELDIKGFCIVDLDPKAPNGQRVQWQFIPVKARPFVTIDVHVPPQTDDPNQAILEAIARTKVDGAVVRVRITIPKHLVERIDEHSIRTALQTAQFITPLAREIIQDRRLRIGAQPQTMKPEDALRAYLGTRGDLDEHLRLRAQEQGESLIHEEFEGV